MPASSPKKRTSPNRFTKTVQLPAILETSKTAQQLRALLQKEWRTTDVTRERFVDFFRRLDFNNNGRIDFDEFCAGIKKTSPETLGMLDIDSLRSMFRQADEDGRDGIDFHEMFDFLFNTDDAAPEAASAPISREPKYNPHTEFGGVCERILSNVKQRPYNASTFDAQLAKPSPRSPRSLTFLTNTNYLAFSTTKRPRMAPSQPFLPPVTQPAPPPLPPTPPPTQFEQPAPWRFGSKTTRTRESIEQEQQTTKESRRDKRLIDLCTSRGATAQEIEALLGKTNCLLNPGETGIKDKQWMRRRAVPPVKAKGAGGRPSPKALTARKAVPAKCTGAVKLLSSRYVGFVNELMES